MVTPVLFARYPTVEALAEARQEDVEEIIRSTGFFRMKARAIREMCQDIVSRFGGEVPARMEDLVTLRGVGRKTANVVLGVAFGVPGFPVDTHVTRLTRRLRLTSSTDPVDIERDVCSMVPEEEWTNLSLRLILHGRRVCVARSPRCPLCVLNDICPSAQLGPLRPRPARSKPQATASARRRALTQPELTESRERAHARSVDGEDERLGARELAQVDPARLRRGHGVDHPLRAGAHPARPGREGERDARVDERLGAVLGNARLDDAERLAGGQLRHQRLGDAAEQRLRGEHAGGVVEHEHRPAVDTDVLDGKGADAGAGVEEADRDRGERGAHLHAASLGAQHGQTDGRRARSRTAPARRTVCPMQGAQKLTPLDASFLHLETPRTHMHIGGVAIFEPSPLGTGRALYDGLAKAIAPRLDLMPRYRQKLAFVPLSLDTPVWVDDPDFDMSNHLLRAALPKPGGDEELQELIGRVFSRQLDRRRPLVGDLHRRGPARRPLGAAHQVAPRDGRRHLQPRAGHHPARRRARAGQAAVRGVALGGARVAQWHGAAHQLAARAGHPAGAHVERCARRRRATRPPRQRAA